MKSNNNHIIEITDLTIGYKTGRYVLNLLKGINLSVNTGELVAIIGRNGTGKSTLIRTLCGLHEPISGSIYLAGFNISKLPVIERARKMSYVSTEIIHVSHMRVTDLVALGRIPHTSWLGKLTAKDKSIISDAIEAVGLTDKKDSYIDEVSDGERQKVMIARALSQDTEIIFLDEPTAFLDVISRYEMFHLLHKLTRENSKSIIFSTHDFQVALTESDRIWMIENNNLIQGAPEDLVLSGAISAIFDSEHLIFDINNAAFSVKKESFDSINIEGIDSPEKLWTMKALERLGYKVYNIKGKIPSILVKQDNIKTTWMLQKKSGTMEFNSIYELSLHLRNLSN